jgi:Protein of Unknown function (DUF2784)
MLYCWAADAVVVAHLAYVLFVILGLLFIFIGRLLSWNWVRNIWFRGIHLTMIMIVVVESLLSITCPLTSLENYLRNLGGQQVDDGTFIGRLAHDILFFDIPAETFVWIYCGFGVLVILSWVVVRPRYSSRNRSPSSAMKEHS